MAMERLVTALVFCEAPLDADGTSAATGLKAAAAPRRAGDHAAATPAAVREAGQYDVSAKSRLPGRRAECAPALDGLNCFETVVMH